MEESPSITTQRPVTPSESTQISSEAEQDAWDEFGADDDDSAAGEDSDDESL